MSRSVPHIKRLVWCALLVVAAMSAAGRALQAQQNTHPLLSQGTTEKFRIGLFGNIGWDLYSADMSGLPGVPNCCPRYTEGNGNALVFGGIFASPMTPTLFLGMRGMFTAGTGALVTDELETIDDHGEAVEATFEHSIEANLSTFSLEPMAEYYLPIGLILHGGLQAGMVVRKDYLQQERLKDPPGVRYSNGQRTRLVFAGEIPEALSFHAALIGGVRYEVPLNSSGTVVAAPEAMFALGLTPVVSGIDWGISTFRIGASIQYRIVDERQLADQPPVPSKQPVVPPVKPPVTPPVTPPIAQTPDTAVAAPPPTDTTTHSWQPLLTANIHATYTNKVTGFEEEAEKVTLQNIRITNLSPLLNYVFFEEGSADLPLRYRQRTKKEIQGFQESKLKGDPLEVYYNVLDIIGQRMKLNPSTSITLVGCNADIGVETGDIDLSRRRAETIRNYLTSVWGVSGKRIRMEARNLPVVPSRSNIVDGNEENRRVEIISNSWALTRPVLNADTLLRPDVDVVWLRPRAIAEAGAETWRVTVQQGGNLLKEYSGTGDVPSKLEWVLAQGARTLSLSGADVTYTLTVTDKSGQTATDTKPLDIEMVYDLKGHIEKYSMIIFPFNTSELTSHHKRVADIVKKQIEQNSLVEVTGHTDRIGDTDYNLRLSEDRARAVAKELGVPESNARGLGNFNLLYPNELPEGRYYCRTVGVVSVTPNK